jgi:hypothetical protein
MTVENIKEQESVDEENLDAQDVESIDEDQILKFNQRQVSDVIKRERQRAYEKGRKEALMQQELQQQYIAPVQQNVSQQNQIGLGGVQQGLSEDQVRQMIAEQAPEVLQAQMHAFKQDHLVNTFVSKMQAAEAKHPGLEAELNKLNFNDPSMHAFIELANTFDNTADIMKEVIDHPNKLTTLLAFVQQQPYIAQKQMQALSQSIKVNDDAKAYEATARDPIRQLNSSSTAGINSDSSSMSVADFQKMFKSRK